jgi:hypothetical protein
MARELHVRTPAACAAIKANRYGEPARRPSIRRKGALYGGDSDAMIPHKAMLATANQFNAICAFTIKPS